MDKNKINKLFESMVYDVEYIRMLTYFIKKE